MYKRLRIDLILCPMMGRRASPYKNPKLVMKNGIYHVKYSVRNSLDKLKRIASIKIKGLL